MELFKQIPGYESYSVSNHGRIINITGKEISQRISSNGYLRVNLRKGNTKYEKPHVASVHRLVADAFLMPKLNQEYVNHIDGNKLNNNVSNLEWCTASYNSLHSYKIGLQKVRKGIESPFSNKVYQYDVNMNVIQIFGSAREAQRETGVNNACISACCNGKQKSAGGFIWSHEGVI